MYGWLWRKLPGGWPAKLLQSTLIVVAVVAVLVVWVFPWVEPQLPFSENTVDGGEVTPSESGTPTGAPTPSSPTDVPGLPGDSSLPGE